MIIGTTSKLTQLYNRLLNLHQQAVKEAALSSVPIIRHEIEAAHRNQKAPSNQAWKELKDPKKRNRPILQGLESYYTVGIGDQYKVFVRNAKWYAKFHFTGTKYMVNRRSLPFPGEKVPHWEQSVATAVQSRVLKLVGGK